MSIHLFELLFFAIIAFLIISKFIATLGTTNEEDAARYKSFFGESATIKDVTNTASAAGDKNKENTTHPSADIAIDEFIDINNKENITKNLVLLQSKAPNFVLGKFIRAASEAFKMIIEGVISNDDKLLSSLIDKRYLEQFNTSYDKYGQFNKPENLQGKISDIYMFGNNAFIKILYTGNDIFTNHKTFKEEWTFSKSLNISKPDWYLSNIE